MGGGMLLCQPPMTHTYTNTHALKMTNCLPVLQPCLSTALLCGSWLDGDAERKVCFCILFLVRGALSCTRLDTGLCPSHTCTDNTQIVYFQQKKGGHSVCLCIATHHSSHPELWGVTRTAASPAPFADNFCLSAQTPFL